MLTLWVHWALARSRYGRAMRATAESENASRALGINVTGTRTLAFAVSAALAGLGGGLFANLALFVNHETFTFSASVELLLMTILGGSATLAGPVARQVETLAAADALGLERDVAARHVRRRAQHRPLLGLRQVEEGVGDRLHARDQPGIDAMPGDDQEADLPYRPADLRGDGLLCRGVAGMEGRNVDDRDVEQHAALSSRYGRSLGKHRAAFRAG
jgi:hypothetical protein